MLAAALLAASCGGPDESRRQSDPPAKEATESLAVAAGPGLQIWFTLTRTARSTQGAVCSERGLEIRRGGSRVAVPLLYTGETPTVINDSTMRAVLWTNCRPVKPYLVDLRSGQPRPEPEKN